MIEPKATVMIVEDNHILALVTMKMVYELNYECVGTAHTESESLELALKHHPDIVLMDVKLGSGNGVSAANKITNACNSAILFISGSNSHPELSELSGTFPYDFLSKPFLKEDLELKLNEILNSNISNK